MSADLEPVWRAWVEAHHANGCAERRNTDAEHCRYRSAHIRTAREIAAILADQGWELRRMSRDAETLPLFGDRP